MKSLLANRKLGNMGGWQDRHDAAIARPLAFEEPIVKMLQGWRDYAIHHNRRYDSKVGDDGVLGKEWQAIGEGLLGLLNGELGRLDGGTLDGFIRDTITDNGGVIE